MNTSIIIPIHEINEKTSPLLSKALESIESQERINEIPDIYFVFPKKIKEDLEKIKNEKTNLNINLIENDGNTDFQTQINKGVSEIKTDYFSILEFDDEYSTTYFHNVEKYLKYYDDIDVFLNILIEVNEKNEALKLTNEVVWSQQFVGENGEMGYLNLNGIKQNTDFKISGSIIKKEEYLNLGGLKRNIKLTFNYEFLLRALNNACKVFVIPKIGYKHFTGREDSLFDKYGKSMSMEERRFWFDTATKEANFTNDRIVDTSVLKQKEQNVEQK